MVKGAGSAQCIVRKTTSAYKICSVGLDSEKQTGWSWSAKRSTPTTTGLAGFHSKPQKLEGLRIWLGKLHCMLVALSLGA